MKHKTDDVNYCVEYDKYVRKRIKLKKRQVILLVHRMSYESRHGTQSLEVIMKGNENPATIFYNVKAKVIDRKDLKKHYKQSEWYEDIYEVVVCGEFVRKKKSKRKQRFLMPKHLKSKKWFMKPGE